MFNWINKIWIEHHLKILGALIMFGLAWYFQYREYVKADLTVTGVQYDRETPKYKIYLINFDINNSGNSNIKVVSAAPFVDGQAKQELPRKWLLDNDQLESFQNNIIEGKKIVSFPMHIHIEKTLIEQGEVAQTAFNKRDNNNNPSVLRVGTQVIIYGGSDRKYRIGKAFVELAYSNSKQVQKLLQTIPSNFEVYNLNPDQAFAMHE